MHDLRKQAAPLIRACTCMCSRYPGPVEEILDDIVNYYLPRMDQGSLRHSRAVIKTWAALYGIAVTDDKVAERISRCGFIQAKIPGRRLRCYVSVPGAPAQST